MPRKTPKSYFRDTPSISNKVMLKDDYNGFFADFKGQVLHIERRSYCNENDSGSCFVIEEFKSIDKHHLVKSCHFKRPDGTTIC